MWRWGGGDDGDDVSGRESGDNSQMTKSGKRVGRGKKGIKNQIKSGQKNRRIH